MNGVQGGYPPAGVWGSAPSPVPQHKKASVASARRAQETRLAQPLPEYQRKRRGHPLPGGAAPLLFKKHYQLSLERPAFLAPFGRSQRSTGFAAGSAGVLLRLPASSRVSCVPVAQSFALPCLSQISAFCALAARSPCICSHLRVALRCAQQPTGLTLPSGAPAGRFALRATAHRADASLRCAPGRFATSGGKCPQGTRFPSRLRSLATLTAFAAAEVFGALPQTPARA